MDWAHRGHCADPATAYLWVEATHRNPAHLLCRGCPVLDQCRAYAAQFEWTAVVVGGWQAPTPDAARPPWAGNGTVEADENDTAHIRRLAG